ncbi:hypothetical protein LCGC14_1547450 [marine sediment metagenome]|uniref:DUF4062 domain-containing protein n=1 Tax=marine sediment metagenome TaxID=412755 RepID=A0A0F9L780_9ZZZZ
MKVYVSGSFTHRAEVRRAALLLGVAGHHVTSHWLTEPDMRFGDPAITEWEERQRCNEDVLDVRRSDVFLLINRWASSSGGYPTEMGIAIEREMPIIVVGTPRNIFYRWPYVRMAASVADAINMMGDM